MRAGLAFLLAAAGALAACVTDGPPALVAASAACLAPADLADADDRWTGFPDGACARETTFREAGLPWRIQTVDSGRRGPLFVLPHDDENAALSTGAYALSGYGGALTAVDTGGRRNAGRIDPNRHFHAPPLACRGPRADRYVAAMLAPPNRPVIALHTNERGAEATGGSGSISIRAPYDGATAFPSRAATGGLANEDAMVILASRTGPADRRVRRLTERLNAAGVHVLVETVNLARTDCSLSHHAVAAGLPYANVEVVDGDAATQRRILDIVLPLL